MNIQRLMAGEFFKLRKRMMTWILAALIVGLIVLLYSILWSVSGRAGGYFDRDLRPARPVPGAAPRHLPAGRRAVRAADHRPVRLAARGDLRRRRRRQRVLVGHRAPHGDGVERSPAADHRAPDRRRASLVAHGHAARRRRRARLQRRDHDATTAAPTSASSRPAS